MTRKILVSSPPGAGMRIILQFLEILAGSYNYIQMDENGGTHAEDNSMLNNGPNTASWNYLPFHPREHNTEVPEKLLKVDRPVPYVFIAYHYDTDDIIENLDKLDDWVVLKLHLPNLEQATFASVLNSIKFKIPHGNHNTKQAMLALPEFINSLVEDWPAIPSKHLTENIIDVEYFEFFTNPEPYLKKLMPGLHDRRYNFCIREVKRYWDRQHEDI